MCIYFLTCSEIWALGTKRDKGFCFVLPFSYYVMKLLCNKYKTYDWMRHKVFELWRSCKNLLLPIQLYLPFPISVIHHISYIEMQCIRPNAGTTLWFQPKGRKAIYLIIICIICGTKLKGDAERLVINNYPILVISNHDPSILTIYTCTIRNHSSPFGSNMHQYESGKV